MRSIAWLLGSALILLAPLASRAAPQTIATVVNDAGDPARRASLEQQLIQAVRAAGHAALAPEQVQRGLRGSDSTRDRRRAATLLAEAAVLVQQVSYDEALRKLESAENAALEGLARLAEPGLLAEIYYQRGVALLPTDQEAARRYLVQSLTIQPARHVGPGTSPKIAAALRRAAQLAASTPLVAPGVAEGARATTALRVRLLLVLETRKVGGRQAASLFLYDAEQQAWQAARIDTEPGGDVVLRVRLQRAVRGLLPAGEATASVPATTPDEQHLAPVPDTPRPERRARRVLPWIATAASVGLLAAGTVLLVLSGNKADEYRSLADQQPLVEYDSRPRELEESGRTFNTAGIVCLSIGGAAAVAALVLWLLPSRRSTDAASEEGSVPGLLRFTFHGP